MVMSLKDGLVVLVSEIAWLTVFWIVAPEFVLSEMPLPVSLMAPDSVVVPPVRLEMSTEWPALLVIDAPIVTLPEPPESLNDDPLALLIDMLEPMSAVVMLVPEMPAPDGLETFTRLIVVPEARSMPSPAELVMVGFDPPAVTSA